MEIKKAFIRKVNPLIKYECFERLILHFQFRDTVNSVKKYVVILFATCVKKEESPHYPSVRVAGVLALHTSQLINSYIIIIFFETIIQMKIISYDQYY